MIVSFRGTNSALLKGKPNYSISLFRNRLPKMATVPLNCLFSNRPKGVQPPKRRATPDGLHAPPHSNEPSGNFKMFKPSLWGHTVTPDWPAWRRKIRACFPQKVKSSSIGHPRSINRGVVNPRFACGCVFLGEPQEWRCSF